MIDRYRINKINHSRISILFSAISFNTSLLLLLYACWEGSLFSFFNGAVIFSMLLVNGLFLRIYRKGKTPPLISVIYLVGLPIFIYLISVDSLVYLAANTNRPRTIDLFVKIGADVNHESDPRSDYPISVAAIRGNLGVIKVLVRNRANINIQDINGNTALHLAALWKQRQVYDYLLTQGANPKLKNKGGQLASDLLLLKKPESNGTTSFWEYLVPGFIRGR